MKINLHLHELEHVQLQFQDTGNHKPPVLLQKISSISEEPYRFISYLT
jgi:hypothetical protein